MDKTARIALDAPEELRRRWKSTAARMGMTYVELLEKALELVERDDRNSRAAHQAA